MASTDKVEKWAALAQIASAFAVVLSLIYVGLQLDESTRVARNGTHQSILQLKHEWDSWLIVDDDLADLVTRAQSPDSASVFNGPEHARFERYVTSGLNIWEYAYYSRVSEILGDDEWGAWDRSFEQKVLQPSWDSIWVKLRPAYGTEFARHVDSVLVLDRLRQPVPRSGG